VSIPVAIPTDLLPNRWVVRVVVRADAEIFTILFPINIVLISLLLSSVIFKTFRARLFPLSDIALSVYLFTVVRAVSADEKNPDKNKRIIKIIN
jgi:hypothetical protein